MSIVDSTSVYDFSVFDNSGKEVSLETYKGYVLLLVNVASNCKLARSSYINMAKLLEKYYNRGLRILLFPCKQFLSQELPDLPSIREYIDNYDRRFILMDFIDVKGNNIHPLFQFLTKKLPGFINDSVKWNFTSFLVNYCGLPVKRYSPGFCPSDETIEKFFEKSEYKSTKNML